MKLSIITINRNNAVGLRKTIESVVHQTFIDIEYIVIDGASTDESVEVIKQYAKKITYWVSESDKGIYNAMNKGILKAKGEYLLMLNSGDVLDNSINLFTIFAKYDGYDLIYGNVKWLNSENKIIKAKFTDKPYFKALVNSSLGHQAIFIKRKLHEQVGLYDEDIKIVSDWCFYLKALFKYNCTYIHIDEYIAICDRDGMSCLPENEKLIENERIVFHQKYFSLQYEEYLENNKILIDLTNQISIKKYNPYNKVNRIIRKVLRKARLI